MGPSCRAPRQCPGQIPAEIIAFLQLRIPPQFGGVFLRCVPDTVGSCGSRVTELLMRLVRPWATGDAVGAALPSPRAAHPAHRPPAARGTKRDRGALPSNPNPYPPANTIKNTIWDPSLPCPCFLLQTFAPRTASCVSELMVFAAVTSGLKHWREIAQLF